MPEDKTTNYLERIAKLEAKQRADEILAKEREKFRSELRKADMRLYRLQKEMNDVHFMQLNENAKRTIEERAHFVSTELFDPFKDIVTKYMATQLGQSKGMNITLYFVILIAGILISLAIYLK